MGVIKPFHNRPSNSLQANVPIVRFALAAFRIGLTVPWPETQGSVIDSSNITGDLLIKIGRLNEDHALDTHKHL
jgi:hypothetical protein